MSRTTTSFPFISSGNFSAKRCLCLFSITKIISAQMMCLTETLTTAEDSVPADFTLCSWLVLKIVSAVALLHLFLLQTKSIFNCLNFYLKIHHQLLQKFDSLSSIYQCGTLAHLYKPCILVQNKNAAKVCSIFKLLQNPFITLAILPYTTYLPVCFPRIIQSLPGLRLHNRL